MRFIVCVIAIYSDEEVDVPAVTKKQKEKGNKKEVKVGNEEDEEEGIKIFMS